MIVACAFECTKIWKIHAQFIQMNFRQKDQCFDLTLFKLLIFFCSNSFRSVGKFEMYQPMPLISLMTMDSQVWAFFIEHMPIFAIFVVRLGERGNSNSRDVWDNPETVNRMALDISMPILNALLLSNLNSSSVTPENEL